MARTRPQEPSLTPGNRIYLYGLLARELGCGRQTFLPRVEEVLASERLGAEDLGFATTRALLEALGPCIDLTVFKGGRIYATVIAQPSWDDALTVPAEAKADAGAKGGKPWKRRKADKALKPVKPRRVKRAVIEEPAEEPAAVVAATEASVEDEPAAAEDSARAPESAPEPLVEPAGESDLPAAPEAEAAKPAAAEPAPMLGQDLDSSVSETPAAAADAPQPTISLTVTYDPYSGSEQETTLEASPAAPAQAAEKIEQAPTPAEPEAAEPAAAGAVAPAAKAEPAAAPSAPEPTKIAGRHPHASRPSPEALASYPRDFAAEVYLSGECIAKLIELLPRGVDAVSLLQQDYARAQNLELIRGTRSRMTFPLRIEHENSAQPLTVMLKRQVGSGLPWKLNDIA